MLGSVGGESMRVAIGIAVLVDHLVNLSNRGLETNLASVQQFVPHPRFRLGFEVYPHPVDATIQFHYLSRHLPLLDIRQY